MKTKKNCGTCAWADRFDLTPTGRFRRSTVGRCTFVVHIGPRPYAVSNIQESRMGLRPGDGADCAVWLRREEAAK